MKEDFEDVTNKVETKLPGRILIWIFLVVCLLLVFVIGFGIGFSASSDFVDLCDGREGCQEGSPAVYLFVNNNSESCPPLSGERLITTLGEGQSFDGLTVNLQCEGTFIAFPLQIKCQRVREFSGEMRLRWSNLPVCYPPLLVTPQHWAKLPHARSVTCSGTPGSTSCKLHCIQSYVAVEERRYSCDAMPCRSWTIEDKKCYICSQECDKFKSLSEPEPSSLLGSLTCDTDCDKIVVTSSGLAAVWQNKRTGLFTFLGEHNGRPVYQNNVTKEYLYYTTTGAEWLVGPDFRKPHAGIQVFQNEDKTCPERHGGKNITKLYIDSSEPTAGGGGMWKNDSSITLDCYQKESYPVQECSCTKYKIYNTVYHNGTVPKQVKYLSGVFTKVEEDTMGFLAPLYKEEKKNLYLFSHHPNGLVWQISQKFTTTPLRGVFSSPACPDSEDITWEWYNKTTPLGQQLYVKDFNIKVKCVSHFHGA